jgi:hypothetical protein
MDMQGAFDGKTSPQQSAALVGLGMVLSTKSLYNMKNNLEANTVQNLDLFASVANIAFEQVGKAAQAPSMGEGELGDLQVLLRDWEFFEKSMSTDQCREQMKEHHDEFFNPNGKNYQSVASLAKLFRKMTTFCLPNPGRAVASSANKEWDGSLEDIDDDFSRFLDILCRETFAPESFANLPKRSVLLTPGNFGGMVETLAQAFAGLNVVPDRLADVIGQAKNLTSKEEAILIYKGKMDRALEEAPFGEELAVLTTIHQDALNESLKSFESSALALGDPNAKAKVREDLDKDLKERFGNYVMKNQQRLNKILLVFAPITILSIIAFVVDTATDYTCDSFSQTCRDLSKILLCFYGVEFLLLILCTSTLLYKKGFVEGSPAVLELLQACWTTSSAWWTAWREQSKAWLVDCNTYFENTPTNQKFEDLRVSCEKLIALCTVDTLMAIFENGMKFFKNAYAWLRAIYLALKMVGGETDAQAPANATAPSSEAPARRPACEEEPPAKRQRSEGSGSAASTAR